ncbi:hypothetical protein NPIL_348151, partial [Nephila pilipes]
MHSKNGLPIEDKVSEKIDTGEARRKKTRQESDKELKGKIMDEIDDKKIKTQKKGKQVDEVAILKKGVEETKREKAHDEMAATEVGRNDYEGKGKKTDQENDDDVKIMKKGDEKLKTQKIDDIDEESIIEKNIEKRHDDERTKLDEEIKVKKASGKDDEINKEGTVQEGVGVVKGQELGEKDDEMLRIREKDDIAEETVNEKKVEKRDEDEGAKSDEEIQVKEVDGKDDVEVKK